MVFVITSLWVEYDDRVSVEIPSLARIIRKFDAPRVLLLGQTATMPGSNCHILVWSFLGSLEMPLGLSIFIA